MVMFAVKTSLYMFIDCPLPPMKRSLAKPKYGIFFVKSSLHILLLLFMSTLSKLEPNRALTFGDRLLVGR